VDQVWVQANGQVLLLDTPLSGAGPGPVVEAGAGAVGEKKAAEAIRELQPLDAAEQERALGFLVHVAVLALEGCPRTEGPAPTPIRAPLPVAAATLLGRLLASPQPYARLEKVQANLLAQRDQPAEVTRVRRAAHLAVQTAFLFVGLVCCMLPAGLFPVFATGVALTARLERAEQALQELERGALSEFGLGLLNPHPLVRVGGALQLDADLRLRAQLQQTVERDRFEREVRLGARVMTRPFFDSLEKEREKRRAVEQPARARRGDFRKRADDHLANARTASADILPLPRIWSRVALVAWPALWVLWAFAARGGFSFKMVGIALVQADGRQASRWQCAWRALLVWTPVTILLLVSVWLDDWYWSAWQPGISYGWKLALSSVAWWAAVLLLLAYVALAVWFPTRSLHDRLAGTYLVPR
jgi:hypothetical protein